jgi:hypothetical protein
MEWVIIFVGWALIAVTREHMYRAAGMLVYSQIWGYLSLAMMLIAVYAAQGGF